MSLPPKARENLATHDMFAVVTYNITVDELVQMLTHGGRLPLGTHNLRTPPDVGCFRCERVLEECVLEACTGEASPDLVQ